VYDTLNKMINDDELATTGGADVTRCCDGAPVESLRTRRRTKLLLTFGSPLDKIAFLFHIQSGGRAGEAREALASATQPLITDTERPPWVNVWSPQDIISGDLDFYDLPDKSNHSRVKNIIDPHATTLLAAHTQYWQNDLIYCWIRNVIGSQSWSGETCE
jgi:hypothetical protein